MSLSSRFFNRQIGNPFSLSLSWVNLFFGVWSYQEELKLELPTQLQKAGQGQFFTNVSLWITIAYFSLNILIHLFEVQRLEKFRGYLNAVALSLESIVTTLYWGFILTCKHLIVSGPGIPLTLDLAIHLLPFVSLSLEYFCFLKRWPVTYTHALVIMYTLVIAYWFWLKYLLQADSLYPYPILDVDTSSRVLTFALVGVLLFLSFCLNKYFHSVIVKVSHDTKKTV
ncbi:hypothetical protein CANARDRAFT_197855 [[Candida] arabinofermentans NRRL YB-2248]|uniref:FAR-17a/AIG1-like protein n=1 Tax=[Candida] arabinofermentans NRRL YB-2248 TaxID=983967 RepID=A0A1E4T273_9ASCO|nr:hypothetical protein CANARDRAFT_197855 [[Candida] arabinofermentans NRRL YB-2248]